MRRHLILKYSYLFIFVLLELFVQFLVLLCELFNLGLLVGGLLAQLVVALGVQVLQVLL